VTESRFAPALPVAVIEPTDLVFGAGLIRRTNLTTIVAGADNVTVRVKLLPERAGAEGPFTEVMRGAAAT